MSNATELLRRALEALELMYFCHADQKWISYEQQKEKIHQQAIAEIEEIRAYLAAEPEAEPVAWTNQDELNTLGTDVTCYMYSEPMVGENNIPLYTISKPASKPMTGEEIKILYSELGHHDFDLAACLIVEFVRAIEKHHGIIPRCENS
jgi:hypothetical protein